MSHGFTSMFANNSMSVEQVRAYIVVFRVVGFVFFVSSSPYSCAFFSCRHLCLRIVGVTPSNNTQELLPATSVCDRGVLAVPLCSIVSYLCWETVEMTLLLGLSCGGSGEPLVFVVVSPGGHCVARATQGHHRDTKQQCQ